jgi:hypothetical protein
MTFDLSRTTPRRIAFWTLLLVLLLQPHAFAKQTASKARSLPSPEKIVNEYLKATGGKKRQAAIRDAVYEWTIEGDGESRARVLTKSPASARSEIRSEGGEMVSAANQRTAWRQVSNSTVETLTGADAYSSKLRAALSGSRLVNFKKMKLLARTVGVEQVGDEQTYVVEFSTREGGRVRLWFGTASKLLVKAEEGEGTDLYSDYRSVNGILEPHRLAREVNGKIDTTYKLGSVRYNTGLVDSLFDPPSEAALEVPKLLRDLASNQKEVDQRVNDYTFLRKVTERELNDRGEVKKEKVEVREVYPIAGWGSVEKLVSENGVPLSPERAAKEEKRVADELEKAERESPKREEEQKRKRAARVAKVKQREGDGAATDESDDDDVGIATFLRASEFISPRRERFRDRDTIVFDFRPRPGFRARTRAESIVSKLSGVVWIDPAERQVMRLEARLVDGFKMGGGLLASIKSGSAMAFEQTRMADGVWLPRFAQVNLSARVLLFAGITVNQTHEFSDYKRFSAKVGDDKLNAPGTP